MKLSKGDILVGINPYSWEEEEFEYIGKETSEMLIDNGFVIKLRRLNAPSTSSGIITVTLNFMRDYGMEKKSWKEKLTYYLLQYLHYYS